MKSNAEKLLDLLAKLAESETVVTDGINDAYQLAGLVSCELDEEYEKVDRLRAELADAVCQAAIGRRAISALLEIVAEGQDFEARTGKAVNGEWLHKSVAILRNAEQVGMGVGE